jgi:alcohol dehydrogenase
VQVGLMGDAVDVPASVVSTVIARELEILGSHGMAAADYAGMLDRVTSGEFDLDRLVRRRIGLTEAATELAALGSARVDGITLIRPDLT